MPLALFVEPGSCYSKDGSFIEFSPTSSEPNTGRVRGPVPCSVPVTPRGAQHNLVKRYSSKLCCSGGDRQSSRSDGSALSAVDTAGQPATSLVIATAHVFTFYPHEEAQGETWAPSSHRAALARQIREVGVDILRVQEGRSRKDHFTVCEGHAMRISAATPGSSGSTELWISTNICDHARGAVQSRRSHP